MKIVCKKEYLQNAMNIVLKAVSQKTTMPILECILIKADDSKVSFTSNDTELAIETVIPSEKCKIAEKGRTAVDARLFSEIIRKINENSDSEISFISDGNIAEISCGNSKFRIQEKDPDQFPELPEVGDKNYVTLNQLTLKKVIRDTIFSILPNDSNKMMGGELFEIRDNALRVVSLDGHRISIRNIELRDKYNEIKAIIPGKSLIEVSRIISGDAEKDVDIFFSKNHAMFRFDETVMVTRLIDGEYFKIDTMLSTDYETKITVNKKDFLDAIERSTILIRESDKKPLILNVNENVMEFKMNSVIGSMDDSVSIRTEGKNIMIAFNPRFLIEALRVIDDEEIVLYMTNPKAPCFIRDDSSSYIYLILPVNFNPAAY